jgi:hypothetical protein
MCPVQIKFPLILSFLSIDEMDPLFRHSGKMKDRSVNLSDYQRAMDKAFGRKDKTAFCEEIFLVTQPYFYCAPQIVRIGRVGPDKGYDLVAIVQMCFRENLVGTFPVPGTVYAESAGDDVVS